MEIKSARKDLGYEISSSIRSKNVFLKNELGKAEQKKIEFYFDS